jgi:hypothetical protein
MDHIPEDLLDRYAARGLPEAEAARVEEHLLICTFCQDRLQLTDDFVAALRSAVDQRQRHPSKPRKATGG